MMKRFWMLSVLILVMVSTAACGGTAQTTAAATLEPTVSSYPYPWAQETLAIPTVVDEAYPGPKEVTSVPDPFLVDQLEIPAPAEGKAVVIGQALTPGAGGKPYTGGIYLAPTVAASDPTAPPLISFSPDTDPRGIQDPNGNVVFANIAPGQYAIVIYSLGGTVIITDPASGDTFLFTVEAGETKDVGVIAVP